MNDIVVFDLETNFLVNQVGGDWEDIKKMGFGTAVVYAYRSDQYYFFGPNERRQCELFLEGKYVVSFNGIRFDNRIVCDDNDPQPDWIDVDLFDLIVKAKFEGLGVDELIDANRQKELFNGSINLAAIVKATLDISKSGSGAEAPKLIQLNRWSEVFAYNLQDVRVTRRLFEYIADATLPSTSCEYPIFDGHGNEIKVVLDQKVVNLYNKITEPE